MLLLVTGITASAHAETVEQLTATAHNVARDGRCEALPAIAARVKELDPDYYAHVFGVDPVIAGCTVVDPHRQIGAPPALTPPAAVQEPRTGGKSTNEAFGLSALGTVAGIGFMAIGAHWSSTPAGMVGGGLFLVGPTLGHVYAGDTWNTGLAIRLASGAVVLVGGAFALRCIGECSQSDHNAAAVGAVFASIGVLTYAGATLYEIGTAPEAAARYNRDHHLDVTVVPTGTGLAIAGTF